MTVQEAGLESIRLPVAGSPGRAPAALTLTGLCAICLVFAFLLFDAYNDAGQNAEQSVQNIAGLVEQDIFRNLELYELSMRAVVDGVTKPETLRLAPELRDRVLFDRSARAPGLGSLLALDANGEIFACSIRECDHTLHLADRDYFIAQRDAPTNIGLYVSQPFQSRLRKGDWSVALSSRIDRPDGGFGGVVVGSISLNFFAGIFEKVIVGQHGAIALFKTDGTLLMRSPFAPLGQEASVAGRELLTRVAARPSGTFEATADADGVRRLYAYRRVGTLPLVVTVGLSIEEIYAGWWRKVVVTGVSLAILCAFVIVLMQQLRAELSRRTKAEAALSALATTDSLTGLANRRKFDQTLDVEWRRAERDASQMTLILLDVDFFKAFNDAYGHQEGDRVLRAVARQVAVGVGRPADVSARYGGEEFVALLPHTDAAGGERVAERIRAAVADLQIVHTRSPHGVVTVSLGVATIKPRYAQHPAVLLRAADAAMYESKARGRNRSFVAARPAPEATETQEAAPEIIRRA